MKILAISDIHSNKKLIKKLEDIIQKENPDLIIIAGDISFFNEESPKVFGYLKKFNKKIFFVPGNHEDPSLAELWEKKYDIENIHKKIIDLGEIVLAGIGGGNVPIFSLTEEEIKEYLKDIEKYFKNKNKIRILVTHVHPQYTISSKFAEGSKEIFEFIKKVKPDIVIHGHIHEAGGIVEKIYDTLIINVSEKPKIIEIDEKKNIKVK